MWTGDTVTVSAHPAVAQLMNGPEKNAVDYMVKRIQKAITVTARKGYHLEQHDIKCRMSRPSDASRSA